MILKRLSVLTITVLLLFLGFPKYLFSANTDFVITSNTEVHYKTGNDFVSLKTEYIREVRNSKYYFPATGEKLFHIPDIGDRSEKDIEAERAFKKASLLVTDNSGGNVKFTIDEKTLGEGMYVVVKNFKSTTYGSPFRITLRYNTHDYVKSVGGYITLVGTSLPKDTVFSTTDKESGTTTEYNYYFSIITDKSIPQLAKIYPVVKGEEKGDLVYYKFSQTDRLTASPYLEFGTDATYKFELRYKTPKTSNLRVGSLPSFIRDINSNIYEISLPREFAETNQRVVFESVSPTPKDIYKDSEGNVLALFEVPADEDSEIYISGYITVTQPSYSQYVDPLNISLDKYIEDISSLDGLKGYTRETKFWEVKDPYIQELANTLLKDVKDLDDLVRGVYSYINKTLDYDESKASSDNERIGAVKALQGGGSVCMEYADSMIAILRAMGIPARAALGYAGITEDIDTNQVRHQWVQIWIPEYGWFSIDPTYESENQKVGPLIDRVLWETFTGDSLSNIRIYSADKLDDLTTNDYSLKIFGVEDIDIKDFKKYNDLIPQKDYTEDGIPTSDGLSIGNWINTFLKATVFGRAIIITTPVLITLFLLIGGISVAKILSKRLRKRI